MTSKATTDAGQIIRNYFHLIDHALSDTVSATVREIAAELGGPESQDQFEEIENAVLLRMRVWAGARLGAA